MLLLKFVIPVPPLPEASVPELIFEAFVVSTFATLPNPTFAFVVPERILAALKLSTLPNPTFALVTPARIVAVESVLAPKPLAVTVPPPAPESTPPVSYTHLTLPTIYSV